jgi:hypothetical protein
MGKGYSSDRSDSMESDGTLLTLRRQLRQRQDDDLTEDHLRLLEWLDSRPTGHSQPQLRRSIWRSLTSRRSAPTSWARG